MPSISDDFQMPIMYQDLRDPSLGMLPGFGMYTNYLGGIRMPREMQNDQFVFQNRKKKEMNSFKTAALLIVGLATGLVLKNKGLFKWVSTKYSGASTWLKNFFKTKPPTPPVSPTP